MWLELEHNFTVPHRALNNDQTQQKCPEPNNFAVRASIALLFLYAGVLKMMCCYYTHFSKYKTERPTRYMGIQETLSHYATTTTYLDIVENHTFVNKKNIESKVSHFKCYFTQRWRRNLSPINTVILLSSPCWLEQNQQWVLRTWTILGMHGEAYGWEGRPSR